MTFGNHYIFYIQYIQYTKYTTFIRYIIYNSISVPHRIIRIQKHSNHLMLLSDKSAFLEETLIKFPIKFPTKKKY